jgi:hypothetical protein
MVFKIGVCVHLIWVRRRCSSWLEGLRFPSLIGNKVDLANLIIAVGI